MANRIVVGCFGSKELKNEEIGRLAYDLGMRAVDATRAEADFLTGACPGYPLEFIRGIKERKASVRTIGISPFCNKEEHKERGLTADFIDVMIYTGLGTGIEGPNAYATRNPTNVMTSNMGIILPGGEGTISELSMLLKRRKPILVGRGLDASFDSGIDSLLENERHKGSLDATYFSSPQEFTDALARNVKAMQ